MPLSEKIQKEICRLSHENKQDDIVNYLKTELQEKRATASDILAYARDYYFSKKSGKTYVINEATINKLGVVVANLKEDEQSNIAAKFFELAAERDRVWGNRNYAQSLLNGNYNLEKSPEKALKYARKAVELSASPSSALHEHKFILARALEANHKSIEAVHVLNEYAEYKSKQSESEKNNEKKEKLNEEVTAAFNLFLTIWNTFKSNFEKIKSPQLTEEDSNNFLAQLKPFLTCKVSLNKFQKIIQEASYFEGRCYEALGKKREAWASYCRVTQKDCPLYAEAIEARKSLLKDAVKNLINGNLTLQKEMTDSSKLSLPNGLTMPTHFGQSWSHESLWFDAVDYTNLETEYTKRETQIDTLIKAKEIELSLFNEVFKKNKDDEKQNSQLSELKQTLAALQKTKEQLTQTYEQHLPENRTVIRRHAAESRFFNPLRSKKRAALIALTEQLIDQRFKQPEMELPPIDLSNKSSRLLITAERLFQEAILSLNDSNLIQLGIPKAKEKPWTLNQYSGTTGYGSMEKYQLGETSVRSEHRTSPKRQRLGDSFLPDHGSYDGTIYPFLKKLTKAEPPATGTDPAKEKSLVGFMIRYSKNHQSVTLEELKSIFENADKDDVEHFNRICFLILEKEQSQWHSATEENFQLGMSIAQARCFLLIEAGILTFKEVFKNNVLFSVYSQTKIINNPKDVANVCQYVDKLYMKYLQTKDSKSYSQFFKKHIKEDKPPIEVLTRQQAHLDLKQVYGGESDTEDEAYLSDLSM